MASFRYSLVAARIMGALVTTLVFFMVLLAFKGYVFSEDPATQEAENIAKKVRQKAEHTEKAEGRRDLVKDEVKVTTDDDGKPMSSRPDRHLITAPAFTAKNRYG